ncbi:hypothetical protein BdWA1_002500 [Babesia duncani]|uniref:Uncharacterized protein n=1 Tax=Babesia duncani TaxID=323732 RepID=A0AAD9PK40_9APIC|nr:hypothetical protein BdWA1_002500 [Babesia duncani]
MDTATIVWALGLFWATLRAWGLYVDFAHLDASPLLLKYKGYSGFGSYTMYQGNTISAFENIISDIFYDFKYGPRLIVGAFLEVYNMENPTTASIVVTLPFPDGARIFIYDNTSIPRLFKPEPLIYARHFYDRRSAWPVYLLLDIDQDTLHPCIQNVQEIQGQTRWMILTIKENNRGLTCNITAPAERVNFFMGPIIDSECKKNGNFHPFEFAKSATLVLIVQTINARYLRIQCHGNKTALYKSGVLGDRKWRQDTMGNFKRELEIIFNM